MTAEEVTMKVPQLQWVSKTAEYEARETADPSELGGDLEVKDLEGAFTLICVVPCQLLGRWTRAASLIGSTMIRQLSVPGAVNWPVNEDRILIARFWPS